jgi:serine/threonine-protein kinase
MDVSELLKAALADRYLIEAKIGTGGMASVYRARDLKHNRQVALKVLHPELGAVLGAERFLSEIQVTAQLHHPHLVPLFDSGEAGGQLFYVMPYIAGESLRHRLNREQQLPVHEAVRIAVAVARTLDYAHRHGVIHRDLKPENILLHDGQPMVTDFGIALALSKLDTTRLTQTGLSLGTPLYMSPEQASGRGQIDARSDIYSLAVVLYEMLTGEPPYAGKSAQAILARVLSERPQPVRHVRNTVPLHVDAALTRALARVPADRFGSAAEFADVLTGARVIEPDATRGADFDPSAIGRRIRALAPWLLAGVALVVAIVIALTPPSLPSRPAIFELTFPDSALPTRPPEPGVNVALSRDGALLAYKGTLGGKAGILLRRMGALRSEFVRGTEGGWNPVFSPDGRWLLFASTDPRRPQVAQLRKVPVQGGAASLVADSVHGGHSWGERDEILFRRNTALWRVSANDAAPVPLALPDQTRGHVSYGWPHVLPGGRAALITIFKTRMNVQNAELGVVTIPDGTVTELGIAGSNARYLTSEHIVFGRAEGSVYAARFSLRRLRVNSGAVPVLDDVMIKAAGAVELTTSASGDLVYKAGAFRRFELAIVDRQGGRRTLSAPARAYGFPRLSPSAQHLAVTIGPANGTNDIWVYALRAGTLTRLTTHGSAWHPEWTPDGRRLAFAQADTGLPRIYWQPWDGSAAAEFLAGESHSTSQVSFSPSFTAFRRDQSPVALDIWIAPTDSLARARPFLVSPAMEYSPRVSPNGRWLAYVSDESGQDEVYVRPLPGPGARVPVSVAGGTEPVWRPNGRELFYRAPGLLMSALIAPRLEFTIERRDTVFKDGFQRNRFHANYDVFADGQRFVVIQHAENKVQMFAILNWREELRQRLTREPDAR